MSVWSRENDSRDRMEVVLAAHRADAADRLAALGTKVRAATELLRDHGAHMTQAEIDDLCDLMESHLWPGAVR